MLSAVKMAEAPNGYLFLLLSVAWASVNALHVVSHFEPGLVYEYQYEVALEMDTAAGAPERRAGFSFDSVIQLHSLWRNHRNKEEQLLHIKFEDLKHVPNTSHNSQDPPVQEMSDQLDLKALRKPLLVLLTSGKIQDIFAAEGSDEVVLNLKRGLASLLQMQNYSGTVLESDVSGTCKVYYQVSGTRIVKRKDYQSCEREEQEDASTNQVFGVSVHGTSESVYTLENGRIASIESKETHVTSLNSQSTIGAKFNSRQRMQLLSVRTGANEVAQKHLKDVLTALDEEFVVAGIRGAHKDTRTCSSCPSVARHLSKLRKRGPDTRKTSATKTFVKIVGLLRKMKKAEIIQLFKTSENTLIPFLIDAAAAASTAESLAAASSYLDRSDGGQDDLSQRFLYACALSVHPSKHLLNTISNIVSRASSRRDIRETAVIILGTVVGKMCSANQCQQPEVVNAKNIILDGLKSSTEEAEVKPYLLAVKSALLPETVPVLLQYIESSAPLAAIALSALQKFPAEHITEKVKVALRHIFTQSSRPIPGPLRLAAAEILLNLDPLYTDVRDIIVAIGKEKPEFSKYLTSKIMSILHSDHPARMLILEVLKDPLLNNYLHLARLGGSSVYVGNMTATKDMLSTYNFDFLFTENGALRQSNTNFYMYSHGKKMHSMQVSLEVKGLDSLFGKEETEEGEEEELTAGMSAMFLGVQLRPVVFFQGYVDLLEKYLSATENGAPADILSGNALVIDRSQNIVLQSGLQAHLVFQGGLSVDVSGKMEFSLFTQESKSTINSQIAGTLRSMATVDATFTAVGVQTQVEADAMFTVVNTASFSEFPVLYCLQLKKDPIFYRESVMTIEGSHDREVITWKRRRNFTFPGSEISLHQDNSKNCKNILATV